MKYFVTILFLTVFGERLFCQYTDFSIPDFLINSENTPSTLKQSEPSVFNNNSKILGVWKDPRNGDEAYYGQFFDTLGSKSGRNIPLSSNYKIIFNPGGGFLNLHIGDLIETASVYSAEGVLISSHVLAALAPQWCGTGFLGLSADAYPYSNGYLAFMGTGGPVQLAKIKNDNTLQTIEPDQFFTIYDAVNVECAVLPNDYYACFWLKATDYESPVGLYASFFTPGDSLFAHQILLKQLYDYGYDVATAPKYIAETSGDSAYLITLFQYDTLAVTTIKVNFDGSAAVVLNRVELPYHTIQPTYNRKVSNFAVSNYRDGKRRLIAGIEDWEYGYNVNIDYANFSVSLNDEGSAAGPIIVDSLMTKFRGKNPYLTSEGNVYACIETGNDIYLGKYDGFTLLDTIKINDDDSGSRETAGGAAVINDSLSAVLYSDEAGTAVSIVSSNGEVVSSKKRIEGTNLIYFNDGSALSVLRSDHYSPHGFVAVAKYSAGLIPAGVDTLLKQPSNSGILVEYLKLSDSELLLFIKGNLNSKLVVLDKGGAQLRSEVISTSSAVHYLTLYREGTGLFWAGWNSSIRLFNHELIPQSDVKALTFYPWIYLGHNKFLMLTYVEPIFMYGNYYGYIVDTTGNVVTNSFIIHSSYDFSTLLLPSDNILFSYPRNNHIYAKVINYNGETIRNEFKVSSTASLKKDIKSTLWGDQVIFSWSDLRTPGQSYDVYASIYKLNEITSVEPSSSEHPDDFALLQNYPNPFNPSTKIKFSVPAASPVTLKVYDILGREAAVLMNKEMLPGSYEVDFNGAGLASGVYFYRLEAGGFVSTKKMILLK